MNYYNFHIGDYRGATSHLSIKEHYIYRFLIDESYEKEKPLTLDKDFLLRRLSLTSDDKEALDAILKEFFVQTKDGYINNRVQVELERIYKKSESARKSANERWSKDKSPGAMPTHNQRNANAMLPNTQYPITHNPIPNTQLKTSNQHEKNVRASKSNHKRVCDSFEADVRKDLE